MVAKMGPQGQFRIFIFFFCAVPPVLLTNPSNITAPDFDNVSLPCVAYGNPVPSVEWEKDGLPLQTNAAITINSSTDSVQLTHTSCLLLASVGYEDAGSYTCTASNELAETRSVTSSPAVLSVYRK